MRKSFVELHIEGRVLPDEIDNFIEDWHNSDNEKSLSEFLGFTEEEYNLWIKNPLALPKKRGDKC